MESLYGIAVLLICLSVAHGQIGLGQDLSPELLQKLIILDQHFQPNNPSASDRNTNPSGSPGKPLKKSTLNAKETGKLETFVSLDKSKGSSSGIANQTELLEKIVVLDRLQDGRSVRINSTIANMMGCMLYPVPNEPQWFQVDIPNYGSRRFPCPKNTLFDAKQCGCGWVDNPLNPIPEELTTQTTEFVTTTKAPCRQRPTNDPHYFEQFVVGHDWTLRRCPMGTLYSQDECACWVRDPQVETVCHPELWLNFNDAKMQDSSGYGIAVGNNGNVRNVSNAGRFDGTGTLTVWQYSNQDLGTELTINLRFYEFKGGQSEEQVLIANCYGRRLGSVEIAINQVTKEVIFRGDATLSEPAELRLPYKEKSWKNVTLTYNGQELTGQVDQEIKSVPLKGHLATRFHGFNIGSCNGRSYVGYIDDLRLYRCLLDGTTYSFGGFGGMGAVQNAFNMPGMNGLPGI